MKNLFKIFTMFFLVMIIFTSVCTSAYATNITIGNLDKSLNKYMNTGLIIEGSDGSTAKTSNEGVTNIRNNKIIENFEGYECEIINYSIDNEGKCKFNMNTDKLYNLFQKVQGFNISTLSNDEISSLNIAVAFFTVEYFSRCFIATADAIGQDVSLAYTYMQQQASDDYQDVVFNKNNSVFNWKTTTKENGLLDIASLEINTEKLSKIKKSDLNVSKPYYTVILKCEKVTGLKNKTQSTKTITLQWNKNENSNGYEVFKYDSRKKKYVKLGTTKNTYYKVTGLKAGNKYKFKVRAYKKINGKKEYGEYSSVKELTTKTNSTQISKIKSKKNKVTLNWKRASKASGYEVKYSSNKKFKSNNIIVNIKKNKSTSTTIKNLESKKKYYFKVRTYIKINGQKVYSSYSSTKSIKIK